jgi:hypothetical protein
MVMMNYLVLERDKPTRLHFSDHMWTDRMIFDKEMGKEKPVRSLTFWVDEVEGEVSFRTFSILSPKLADKLAPYLPDSRFRDFDFIITKVGEGWTSDWNLEVIPRPPHK